MHNMNLKKYWNNRFINHGHTGWKFKPVYKYDQRLRLKELSKILDHYNFFNYGETKEILDIGCGTGDFLAFFSKYNVNLTGIDLSPAVIEFAKERFKNQKNVHILAKDIKDFYPEHKFDLILSITVMQHIIEDSLQMEILQNLRNYLKPGGILILLESILRKKKEKYDNSHYYLNYKTIDEWIELFIKCGYKIHHKTTYPHYGIKFLQFLKNSIVKKDYNSKKLSNHSFKFLLIKLILFFFWPIDYWFTHQISLKKADRIFFILKK